MLKEPMRRTLYIFVLVQVLIQLQTLCYAETDSQTAEITQVTTQVQKESKEEIPKEKKEQTDENQKAEKVIVKSALWAPPRISVYTKDLGDFLKYCPDATTRHEYSRPNFKGQMVNCDVNYKENGENNSLTMNKIKEMKTNIIPKITSTFAQRTLVHPVREIFKVPNFTKGSICANFKIPQMHHTEGVIGTDILLYIAAGPMQSNETESAVWVERCPTGEGNPIVLGMNFNPKKITVNNNIATLAIQEMEKAIGTSSCSDNKALIMNIKGIQKESSNNIACVSVKCTEDNKNVQVKNAGESEGWKSCTDERFTLPFNTSKKILCPKAEEICDSKAEEKVVIPRSSNLQPMRILTPTLFLDDEEYYCPENSSKKGLNSYEQRSNLDGLFVPCSTNDNISLAAALTQEKREKIKEEIIPHILSVYKEFPLIYSLQSPIIMTLNKSSACYHLKRKNDYTTNGVENKDFVLFVSAAPMRPLHVNLPLWARPCTTQDGRVVSAEINFNPAMIMGNESMKEIAKKLISNITGTSHCPKESPVMLPAKKLNGLPTTVCLSLRCKVNHKVLIKLRDNETEWKECDPTSSYALPHTFKHFKCPKYEDVCTKVEIIPEVKNFVMEEVNIEEPKKEDPKTTVQQQKKTDENVEAPVTHSVEKPEGSVFPNEFNDTNSADHTETSLVGKSKGNSVINEIRSDKSNEEQSAQQEEEVIQEEEEEKKVEMEEEEKEMMCHTNGGVCVKNYPNTDVQLLSLRIGQPRIHISTMDLIKWSKHCPAELNKMLHKRPNFKGGEEYCIGKFRKDSDGLTEGKKTEIVDNVLPKVKEMIVNKTLIHRLHTVAAVPYFSRESPCSHFTIPTTHQQRGLSYTDIFFYVAAGPMSEEEKHKSVWAERCPTNEGDPIVVAINFNPRKILINTDITRFAFKAISKALGISTCDEGKPLIVWKRPSVTLTDSTETCVHVKCEEGRREQVQRQGETDWKECARLKSIRNLDESVADPAMCDSVRGVCLNSHIKVRKIPFSPNLKTLRIVPSFEDLEYIIKQCPEEHHNVNMTTRILDGVRVACRKHRNEDISDILTSKKEEALRKEIVPNLISMLQSAPLLYRRKTALRIPKFEKNSTCSRFYVPKEHRIVGLHDTDVVFYVAASPFPLYDSDVPVWAQPCADINGRAVAVAINFNPARIMDISSTLDAAYVAVAKALGTMNCLNNVGVMLRGKMMGASTTVMTCVNVKCEEKGEVYLRGNDMELWQKCGQNNTVKLLDESFTINCPIYNDICSIVESGSKEPTPEYDSGEDNAIIDVSSTEEEIKFESITVKKQNYEKKKGEMNPKVDQKKEINVSFEPKVQVNHYMTTKTITETTTSYFVHPSKTIPEPDMPTHVEKTPLEKKNQSDKMKQTFRIRLSAPDNTPETPKDTFASQNSNESVVKPFNTALQHLPSNEKRNENGDKKAENRLTKNNGVETLLTKTSQDSTNLTNMAKDSGIEKVEKVISQSSNEIENMPSEATKIINANKNTEKVEEITENVHIPLDTSNQTSTGGVVDRKDAIKKAKKFWDEQNLTDKSYLESKMTMITVLLVIVTITFTQ